MADYTEETVATINLPEDDEIAKTMLRSLVFTATLLPHQLAAQACMGHAADQRRMDDAWEGATAARAV
eukprot:COSAG02_NODE_25690_length_651_cov_4.134058_1_plen_68_part_00